MEIDDAIEKYALENAIKYSGKATAGSVISHVMGSHPEVKSDMKNFSMKVSKEVAKVNKLSAEDQLKIAHEKYPEIFEEKKKEKSDELKEMENVDLKSGVIMRFAPSPSGPMHLGHAVTGGLTSLYVKKYGGKFILRIEDTNSDNIDPFAYEQLPKDGEWIFGNVTDVWVQSDRMNVYYDYVKMFLDREAVYVCTCSQDEFKDYVMKKQECPCRNLGVEEQKKRWSMMFDKNAFKEGDAVVRFKSDMTDKNPAMRDFPLVRINDSVHPRQGTKYRVWPLMNLCVTVDDIEAGMTHIIRAKDHADNAKRQEKMYEALGIKDKFPVTYFLGRYNFEGLELSCSKTKARINAGEFTGWDDIRLPFLIALKRRGYSPEAFMKYTRLVGMSPVDKTVSGEEFFKTINSFNKEIIDPIAHRFFLIREPILIKIIGSPEQAVTLDLHPTNKKGGRDFKTAEDFYIEKSDFESFQEGNLYRLMDCLNFRKQGENFVFDSIDYEAYKNIGKRIIHWLPAKENLIDADVLMPDATIMSCLAEPAITHVKVDDVIQAERFGFMRLDRKEKGKDGKEKLYFWFTHQ